MPEQKLLPPAKEGRIYYDQAAINRSRKILELHDEVEWSSETLNYWKREYDLARCELTFFMKYN